MKRTGLLGGLTQIGRLRRRLDDISSEVAAKALARGDAAELIASEILAEITNPDSELLLELRADAALVRARLTRESERMSVLEAARALCDADAAAMAVPADRGRSQEILALARPCLGELRALRSRRTVLAMCGVIARHAIQSADPESDLDEVFRILPEVAAGAVDAHESHVLAQVTDALAVVTERCEERRCECALSWRPALLQAAIELDDPERVAPWCDAASALDPGQLARLARVVARHARPSTDMLSAIALAITNDPAIAVELEPRLHTSLTSDADSPSADLRGLEAALRTCASLFPSSVWPWAALVKCALARSDDALAVGTFARMGPAETGEVALRESIATALLLAGFPRTAAKVGAEVVKLLARAELALESTAPLSRDTVFGELERVLGAGLVPPRLVPRVHRLRARLLFAVGEFGESARLLEKSLSHHDGDPEVALDLAETALALEDAARATAFVKLAAERGATARGEDLLARALACQGDRVGAALALERALALFARAESSVDTRVAFVDAVARVAGANPPSSVVEDLQAEVRTPSPWRRVFSFNPDTVRRRAAFLADSVGDGARVRSLLGSQGDDPSLDDATRNLLARADLRLGEPTRAVERLAPLEAVLDPEALTLLAIARAMTGASRDAAVTLKRARATRQPAPALVEALLLADTGAYGVAASRIAAALKESSPPPAARFELERARSVLLELEGDRFGALAALSAALEAHEDTVVRERYAELAFAIAVSEPCDVHARRHLVENGFMALGATVPVGTLALLATVAAEAAGCPSPLEPMAATAIIDAAPLNTLESRLGDLRRRIAGVAALERGEQIAVAALDAGDAIEIDAVGRALEEIAAHVGSDPVLCTEIARARAATGAVAKACDVARSEADASTVTAPPAGSVDVGVIPITIADLFEERLTEARARISQGRIRTARETLQALYQDATAAGQKTCARRAIELMNDATADADARRLRSLIDSVTAQVRAQRFVDALAALGGSVDPTVDLIPELVRLRLLVHDALGRHDAAARDRGLLRPFGGPDRLGMDGGSAS